MIINVLEIQLQTVFYPGFSKRNITSVQTPILEKRILLANKSDKYIMLLAKFGTTAAWYGVADKVNGRARMLVLPLWRRRQKSYELLYYVFLDMISIPTYHNSFGY